MAFTTKVTLNLPKADELIHNLGLDPSGDVQRYYTADIAHRLPRYMPYKSGVLSSKLLQISTDVDTEIVIAGPYAHYQYIGILYVDDVTGSAWSPKFGTKHATDIKLNHDKSQNPQAGPYWDRALVAAEGDAIVADLKRYIERRAKGGAT